MRFPNHLTVTLNTHLISPCDPIDTLIPTYRKTYLQLRQPHGFGALLSKFLSGHSQTPSWDVARLFDHFCHSPAALLLHIGNIPGAASKPVLRSIPCTQALQKGTIHLQRRKLRACGQKLDLFASVFLLSFLAPQDRADPSDTRNELLFSSLKKQRSASEKHSSDCAHPPTPGNSHEGPDDCQKPRATRFLAYLIGNTYAETISSPLTNFA